MTTKNKQGEVMEVHPEAQSYFDKAINRPCDHFRSVDDMAIEAVTLVLNERDEARDEHKFVLAAESAAIDTLKSERDALRTQVAAMREALIEAAVPLEALNLVGNDLMKFHPDTWAGIQNAVTHIRAKLLKDQSNDG